MTKPVLKAVDSDGNPTGEEQKLDELKPIPDDASNTLSCSRSRALVTASRIQTSLRYQSGSLRNFSGHTLIRLIAGAQRSCGSSRPV